MHLSSFARPALILSGIASIYGKINEYDKAKSYFEEALLKAKDHMSATKIYFDLGLTSFENNYFQEAAEAFQEALKLKDKAPEFKNNSEYEIDIRWYLGTIAYEIGNEQMLMTNLTKLLPMITTNHRYYANANLLLGHHYFRKSEFEKARKYYYEVLVTESSNEEEIKMAKDCLKRLPLNC